MFEKQWWTSNHSHIRIQDNVNIYKNQSKPQKAETDPHRLQTLQLSDTILKLKYLIVIYHV